MTHGTQSFYRWNRAGLARLWLAGMVLVLASAGLAACGSPPPTLPPDQEQGTTPDYSGKKVLFVNSYHEGYPWSDGIEKGLRQVLDGTGVELRFVRMDTKQHPEEAFARSAGDAARAEIEAFAPDVVVACDDNAQKYLVVPYLKDTDLPVVFCGVNWDGSIYGFPASNVTGMIEVELPDRLVEHLEAFAQGTRVGYLTVDSETERKVAEIYNERFFDGQMQIYWVKTYAEFQEAFINAQEEVDILFLGNNAGIDRWQDDEVIPFVIENSKIPSGAINDWLAPYVLITLAKSAEEQGEWSGEAAMRILGGTPVSAIDVAENKQEELILNLDIAEKQGVVFPPSMLRNAVIYGSEEGSQ